MQASKHNIISKIKDSDNYYIINLLSQQADIISAEKYQKYLQLDLEPEKDFVEKGYLVDPLIEDQLFQKKYLEFIDNRDTDEIQIFFVLGYTCNFACSYCYQDEYQYNTKTLDKATIDAFFAFIEKKFTGRQKYITLFGGEPLLNTFTQRGFLTYFIEEANLRKLEIAVVTNGYFLSEYIELLKQASVREIQVTLDGNAEKHNARRPLKGGNTTFDKISRGIDDALAAFLPINLRMVIDKQNINELPSLAKYAIDKSWTTNPLFKTQLGRNYELHHCQTENNRLYSRLGMYQDIYELLKEYPEILEFHKPSFSVSKFLFEEGKLPDPLFDSCPGTKTEWAFDYTGKIYSCTATVGKEGEVLGTFYPEVFLDEEKILEWENRDVLAIKECKDCTFQLACGGGCASVAKNNTGKICSTDCRPIKELLELGIGYYFKEEI